MLGAYYPCVLLSYSSSSLFRLSILLHYLFGFLHTLLPGECSLSSACFASSRLPELLCLILCWVTGALISFSGSPRSPSGHPPQSPFGASGVGGRQLEPRYAHRRCCSWLSPVAPTRCLTALGCRLSDLTQYLTVARGLELVEAGLWWWHKLGSTVCARPGW